MDIFGTLLVQDLLDNDGVVKNKPPFASTNLQSPLTDHEIQSILFETAKESYLKKASHNLKSLMRDSTVNIELNTHKYYEQVGTLLHNLDNGLIMNTETPDFVRNSIVEQEWFVRTMGIILGDESVNVIDTLDLDFPQIILGYLDARERWEQIALASACIQSQRIPDPEICKSITKDVYHSAYTEDISVYMSNNFCVLQIYGNYLLIDHNKLLMIHDLISARSLTLAMCFIGHQIHEHIWPPWKLPVNLYKSLDVVLMLYGNQAYASIKSVEPMLVGVLHRLRQKDKLCDQTQFYEHMRKDLQRNLMYDDKLILGFDMILQDLLKYNNPHYASNLHGLYRHWGHPTVSSIEGLTKIKSIGTLNKIISTESVHQIESHTVKLICESHYKKHKKWPRLDLSELSRHSELRWAILGNRPVNQQSSWFDIMDWRLLKGHKTFQLPVGFNIATLLSDKAHTPPKSKVLSNIRQGLPMSSNRLRLLLSWLEERNFKPDELLKDINDNGFIDDDLLVGLHPKERELKEVPRMFATMPMRMRMYFVVMQEMIAENIMKGMEASTMTDSHIDLIKRMYSASSRQSSQDNELAVVVNLDFEKWNTNFREKITDKAFTFIDELFGYSKITSRTHEFFRRATIYVADGSVHLELNDDGTDLKEGPGVFKGHQGGIEGINQKGWTIVTSGMIDVVASRHKIRFILMGQGDNQVLVLFFKILQKDENGNPTDEDLERIKELIKNFMNDLFEFCESAGMYLKPEETWLSSKIFAYGKQMFFEGKPLSMGLKRGCRATMMNNSQFPTLGNSVATVNTAAEGVCMNDDSPILAIFLNQIMTRATIKQYFEFDPVLGYGLKDLNYRDVSFSYQGRNNRISRRLTQGNIDIVKRNLEEFSSVLMSVNASLGFLPTTTPLDFCVREFPDPVTTSLCMLIKLKQCRLTDIEREFVNKMMKPKFKDDVDILMLLFDPVSINVESPQKYDNVLKAEVKKFLSTSRTIQNEDFKVILEIADENQDDLLNSLESITPFDPRVCSDLLSAHAIGQAREIIGRFEKTTTLIKTTYSTVGDTLTDKIVRCVKQTWGSYLYHLTEINDNLNISEWNCSARIAQAYRNVSWQRDDIVNITVPHPAEAFKLYPVILSDCTSPNCKKDVTGYILFGLSEETKKDSTISITENLGPFTPYFGSHTREKTRQGSTVRIHNVQNRLKRTLELTRLLGWVTEPTGTMSNIIQKIIGSITDMPLRILINNQMSVSGSFGHRYQDRFTAHGGFPTTMYTPFSHVNISTNTLSKYCKGGKNYTFHFQATISYFLEQIVSKLLCQKDELMLSAFHSHEVCKECITEISETKLTATNDMLIPKDRQKTHLNWVPKEFIELRSQSQFSRTEILNLSALNKFQLKYAISRYVGKYCHDVGMDENKVMKSSSGIRMSKVPMIWFVDTHYPTILNTFLASVFKDSLMAIFRLNPGQPIHKHEVINHMIRFIDQTSSKFFTALLVGHSLLENKIELVKEGYYLGDQNDVNLTSSSVCSSIRGTLKYIIGLWSSDTYVTNLNKMHYICPNKSDVRLEGYTGRMVELWLSSEHLQCNLPLEKLSTIVNYLQEDWTSTNLKVTDVADLELSLPEWIFSEDHMSSLYLLCGEDYLDVTAEVMRDAIQIFIGDETLDLLVKKIPKKSIRKPTTNPLNKLDLHQVRKGVVTTGRLKFSRKKTGKPLNMQIKRETETTWNYTGFDYDGLSRVIPDTVSPKNLKVPFTQAYKPVQTITTAGYKYTSLFKYIFSAEKFPKHVACLGDGTGGVVLLSHKAFNPEIVFYNSYVGGTNWIPHSISEISCPAIESYPIYKQKTKGLEILREGHTDFTHPCYVSQVSNYMSSLNVNSFDLITCDAEHGGQFDLSKDVEYLESVLKFATGLGNIDTKLVFKTYGTNIECLSFQLELMNSVFRKTELIRSLFSGHGNSELFLLGEGVRSPGIRSDRILSFCPLETVVHSYVSEFLTLPGSVYELRILSEEYSKTLDDSHTRITNEIYLLSKFAELRIPKAITSYGQVTSLDTVLEWTIKGSLVGRVHQHISKLGRYSFRHDDRIFVYQTAVKTWTWITCLLMCNMSGLESGINSIMQAVHDTQYLLSYRTTRGDIICIPLVNISDSLLRSYLWNFHKEKNKVGNDVSFHLHKIKLDDVLVRSLRDVLRFLGLYFIVYNHQSSAMEQSLKLSTYRKSGSPFIEKGIVKIGITRSPENQQIKRLLFNYPFLHKLS